MRVYKLNHYAIEGPGRVLAIADLSALPLSSCGHWEPETDAFWQSSGDVFFPDGTRACDLKAPIMTRSAALRVLGAEDDFFCDGKTLRRRIEDALRKTATVEQIELIADILNVRIV